MSDATPTELRIYCLCGQKMKVTSTMFGKPGKCVACRQKIRIPSEDELPEDSSVIHLKDHPEFLRKPKRDNTPAAEAQGDSFSDIENGVVLLEGDGSDLAAIPFVLFEPVHRLCNYEHKVNQQLQALREGRAAQYDKATLMSYRSLARKSRRQLEKLMRDELIAIASELQAIRESLTNAALALRTGEEAYLAYSKTVLPLRKRREVLIYRQHNLRGWLATEDPHMAGGALEISLTDVPVEHFDAAFPLDREIDSLPIEYAVLKLEEALRQREKADKRLNELHHMNLEGGLAPQELTRLRADTEAERERARTGVAFYRSRLQQVIQDCEEDSGALKAYQTLKKRGLESGAIARGVYEELEESIFRAQVDIKRARNMASRALNANAVSDVPNPRGTFLERLARPGSFRGIGVDSWTAWVGSALLLAVLFVPISSRAPGGNATLFPAFTLALFTAAAALGLTATILARLPRTIALNSLWCILTFAGAAYFEYEAASASLAGAALRAGEPWWSSLGGKLLLAGWAVAGLAAVIGTFPVRTIRWVGTANFAVSTAAAVLILTHYAGALRPEPVLATLSQEAVPERGTYTVTIPLMNSGRRAFWVGGDRVSLPAASTYLVERKIGPNSWERIAEPRDVLVDGVAVPLDLKEGLRIPAGAIASIPYELSAGTYRVQVAPQWPGARPLQHTFELVAFDTGLAPFFASPGGRGNEAGGGTGGGASTGPTVTVELRGVVDGEASQPKFSIILTLPDGTNQRAQYNLGDTLHGDWVISEFSPAHNTMTLTNGQQLRVVERGKPESLPVP